MLLVTVSILLTSYLVSSRLVLTSWDELDGEDGRMDTERLVMEADLVSVTTQPYEDCPEVELELSKYEVVVLQAGEELIETIEIGSIKDITYNTTGTIVNGDEPWIQGTITRR